MLSVLAFNTQVLAASESSFTSEQKKELEQIVHDYIVKNPQVLIEALETLEVQQEQAKQLTMKKNIEFFKQDPNTPKRLSSNKNNKHYLIEFNDYNCTYCKQARKITESFIKKHDLNAYYIEFPILSNISAQAAAVGIALYQKNPEKYFEYQNYLMSHPERLTSFDQIEAALTAINVDSEEIIKLAQNKELQKIIINNLKLGQEIGVKGTPFFIIDGKFVIGGFSSEDDLLHYLDD